MVNYVAATCPAPPPPPPPRRGGERESEARGAAFASTIHATRSTLTALPPLFSATCPPSAAGMTRLPRAAPPPYEKRGTAAAGGGRSTIPLAPSSSTSSSSLPSSITMGTTTAGSITPPYVIPSPAQRKTRRSATPTAIHGGGGASIDSSPVSWVRRQRSRNAAELTAASSTFLSASPYEVGEKEEEEEEEEEKETKQTNNEEEEDATETNDDDTYLFHSSRYRVMRKDGEESGTKAGKVSPSSSSSFKHYQPTQSAAPPAMMYTHRHMLSPESTSHLEEAPVSYLFHAAPSSNEMRADRVDRTRAGRTVTTTGGVMPPSAAFTTAPFHTVSMGVSGAKKALVESGTWERGADCATLPQLPSALPPRPDLSEPADSSFSFLSVAAGSVALAQANASHSIPVRHVTTTGASVASSTDDWRHSHAAPLSSTRTADVRASVTSTTQATSSATHSMRPPTSRRHAQLRKRRSLTETWDARGSIAVALSFAEESSVTALAGASAAPPGQTSVTSDVSRLTPEQKLKEHRMRLAAEYHKAKRRRGREDLDRRIAAGQKRRARPSLFVEDVPETASHAAGVTPPSPALGHTATEKTPESPQAAPLLPSVQQSGPKTLSTRVYPVEVRPRSADMQWRQQLRLAAASQMFLRHTIDGSRPPVTALVEGHGGSSVPFQLASQQHQQQQLSTPLPAASLSAHARACAADDLRNALVVKHAEETVRSVNARMQTLQKRQIALLQRCGERLPKPPAAPITSSSSRDGGGNDGASVEEQKTVQRATEEDGGRDASSASSSQRPPRSSLATQHTVNSLQLLSGSLEDDSAASAIPCSAAVERSSAAASPQRVPVAPAGSATGPIVALPTWSVHALATQDTKAPTPTAALNSSETDAVVRPSSPASITASAPAPSQSPSSVTVTAEGAAAADVPQSATAIAAVTFVGTAIDALSTTLGAAHTAGDGVVGVVSSSPSSLSLRATERAQRGSVVAFSVEAGDESADYPETTDGGEHAMRPARHRTARPTSASQRPRRPASPVALTPWSATGSTASGDHSGGDVNSFGTHEYNSGTALPTTADKTPTLLSALLTDRGGANAAAVSAAAEAASPPLSAKAQAELQAARAVEQQRQREMNAKVHALQRIAAAQHSALHPSATSAASPSRSPEANMVWRKGGGAVAAGRGLSSYSSHHSRPLHGQRHRGTEDTVGGGATESDGGSASGYNTSYLNSNHTMTTTTNAAATSASSQSRSATVAHPFASPSSVPLESGGLTSAVAGATLSVVGFAPSASSLSVVADLYSMADLPVSDGGSDAHGRLYSVSGAAADTSVYATKASFATGDMSPLRHPHQQQLTSPHAPQHLQRGMTQGRPQQLRQLVTSLSTLPGTNLCEEGKDGGGGGGDAEKEWPGGAPRSASRMALAGLALAAAAVSEEEPAGEASASSVNPTRFRNTLHPSPPQFHLDSFSHTTPCETTAFFTSDIKSPRKPDPCPSAQPYVQPSREPRYFTVADQIVLFDTLTYHFNEAVSAVVGKHVLLHAEREQPGLVSRAAAVDGPMHVVLGRLPPRSRNDSVVVESAVRLRRRTQLLEQQELLRRSLGMDEGLLPGSHGGYLGGNGEQLHGVPHPLPPPGAPLQGMSGSGGAAPFAHAETVPPLQDGRVGSLSTASSSHAAPQQPLRRLTRALSTVCDSALVSRAEKFIEAQRRPSAGLTSSGAADGLGGAYSPAPSSVDGFSALPMGGLEKQFSSASPSTVEGFATPVGAAIEARLSRAMTKISLYAPDDASGMAAAPGGGGGVPTSTAAAAAALFAPVRRRRSVQLVVFSNVFNGPNEGEEKGEEGLQQQQQQRQHQNDEMETIVMAGSLLREAWSGALSHSLNGNDAQTAGSPSATNAAAAATQRTSQSCGRRHRPGEEEDVLELTMGDEAAEILLGRRGSTARCARTLSEPFARSSLLFPSHHAKKSSAAASDSHTTAERTHRVSFSPVEGGLHLRVSDTDAAHQSSLSRGSLGATPLRDCVPSLEVLRSTADWTALPPRYLANCLPLSVAAVHVQCAWRRYAAHTTSAHRQRTVRCARDAEVAADAATLVLQRSLRQFVARRQLRQAMARQEYYTAERLQAERLLWLPMTYRGGGGITPHRSVGGPSMTVSRPLRQSFDLSAGDGQQTHPHHHNQQQQHTSLGSARPLPWFGAAGGSATTMITMTGATGVRSGYRASSPTLSLDLGAFGMTSDTLHGVSLWEVPTVRTPLSSPGNEAHFGVPPVGKTTTTATAAMTSTNEAGAVFREGERLTAEVEVIPRYGVPSTWQDRTLQCTALHRIQRNIAARVIWRVYHRAKAREDAKVLAEAYHLALFLTHRASREQTFDPSRHTPWQAVPWDYDGDEVAGAVADPTDDSSLPPPPSIAELEQRYSGDVIERFEQRCVEAGRKGNYRHAALVPVSLRALHATRERQAEERVAALYAEERARQRRQSDAHATIQRQLAAALVVQRVGRAYRRRCWARLQYERVMARRRLPYRRAELLLPQELALTRPQLLTGVVAASEEEEDVPYAARALLLSEIGSMSGLPSFGSLMEHRTETAANAPREAVSRAVYDGILRRHPHWFDHSSQKARAQRLVSLRVVHTCFEAWVSTRVVEHLHFTRHARCIQRTWRCFVARRALKEAVQRRKKERQRLAQLEALAESEMMAEQHT